MDTEEMSRNRVAVIKVGEAIYEVADELRRLGNGNALTSMGALEAHGKAIIDTGEKIADGLQGIGNALEQVAYAIDRLRMGG